MQFSIWKQGVETAPFDNLTSDLQTTLREPLDDEQRAIHTEAPCLCTGSSFSILPPMWLHWYQAARVSHALVASAISPG